MWNLSSGWFGEAEDLYESEDNGYRPGDPNNELVPPDAKAYVVGYTDKMSTPDDVSDDVFRATDPNIYVMEARFNVNGLTNDQWDFDLVAHEWEHLIFGWSHNAPYTGQCDGGLAN